MLVRLTSCYTYKTRRLLRWWLNLFAALLRGEDSFKLWGVFPLTVCGYDVVLIKVSASPPAAEFESRGAF